MAEYREFVSEVVEFQRREDDVTYQIAGELQRRWGSQNDCLHRHGDGTSSPKLKGEVGKLKKVISDNAWVKSIAYSK